MLDLNRTKVIENYINETHSSVAFIEEGSALVYQLEGGKGKLRPSVGGGGEKFAGIAIGRPSTPTIVPRYDTLVVAASSPYTATLTKVMHGNDIRVTVIAANGTRTVLTAGTPGSNATEYSISNGVVTFHSSQAGKAVEIAYMYAISLQEAILKFNFQQNASNQVSDIGTVACMLTGTIYTTMYDITSNWNAGGTVYIGSNGKFTMNSSGGTDTTGQCDLVSVPSSEDSYLGLFIHI